MKSQIIVAAVTSLLACPLVGGLAEGKTGSFTIEILPGADPNSKIRVTAKAENGETYDSEVSGNFTVGGQDSEQTRNTIATDLTGDGWIVENNGSNGIIITGRVADPKFSEIKQVDIGDNSDKINTRVDGNCTLAEAKPGDKDFKFSFLAPNAHPSLPGTVLCNINSIHLTTALAANDSPSQAAVKLQAAMTSAGLVTSLAGADITLDWEVAANAALLGTGVHIDFGILNGAGGPHVQLELPPPDVVPAQPPPQVPAASWWLGALTFITILALGSLVLLRRGRSLYPGA
jgi:hypothetical protein